MADEASDYLAPEQDLEVALGEFRALAESLEGVGVDLDEAGKAGDAE